MRKSSRLLVVGFILIGWSLLDYPEPEPIPYKHQPGLVHPPWGTPNGGSYSLDCVSDQTTITCIEHP